MAERTERVPKSARKGKIHVPRAPKRLTPEQLLADVCDERAAHQQTCRELDSVLVRLKNREQDCINSKAAVQKLQQQMSGLSAELQRKQTDLQLTQDSLVQLQDMYQAAQDDLAVQKAAKAVAEARIADLQLNTACLTASLSDMQHRCELASADLATHKAASSAAECRIQSLYVQLQASSSKCAQLQAGHDDVARQAFAAAAASANRVQELKAKLQDALGNLQQLQVATEASLEVLTNIAADSIFSQAMCEFVMGQHLKAADAAAKAQRDKCAIRDAEARAGKWQLAKSEASVKRLQHEAAQLRQQLAVDAEVAVQLNVKLQTALLSQTAADMRIEEAESATQVVKCHLATAQQKLGDAQDQLFGWACAAAAMSLSPCDPASSSARPADRVCSSPTPAVLHSELPSPRLATNGEASPHSLTSAQSTEPWRPPVILQPFTNLPHQLILAATNQGLPVPVTSDDVSSLVSLPAPEVASHSTSKPATRVPKLYNSLNKVFKGLGVLCCGGFSKHSSSPRALGCHNPVFNSSLSGQHVSIVPSRSGSVQGIADLGGDGPHAAAQEPYCAAAAAAAALEAAADITDKKTGVTGSTAIAAVFRLSRWGSAAAGAGDAGCNIPVGTSDTTVTCNLTDPQNGTDDVSAADAPLGNIAATDVYDDIAIDGEAATVTVIEYNAGGKAGLSAAPAMTDVRAVGSM